VVLHYDGLKWKKIELGLNDSFHGVTGLRQDDVYVLASTSKGAKQLSWYLLHFDGKHWRPIDIPVPHSHAVVSGSIGKQANEVLVGLTDGMLLRYNGQRWREERTGGSVHLHGFWAPGPQDLFVVGGKGTILRRTCPP
jgi:hypothetical protein